jgi:hypothetical protein
VYLLIPLCYCCSQLYSQHWVLHSSTVWPVYRSFSETTCLLTCSWTLNYYLWLIMRWVEVLTWLLVWLLLLWVVVNGFTRELYMIKWVEGKGRVIYRHGLSGEHAHVTIIHVGVWAFHAYFQNPLFFIINSQCIWS